MAPMRQSRTRRLPSWASSPSPDQTAEAPLESGTSALPLDRFDLVLGGAASSTTKPLGLDATGEHRRLALRRGSLYRRRVGHVRPDRRERPVSRPAQGLRLPTVRSWRVSSIPRGAAALPRAIRSRSGAASPPSVSWTDTTSAATNDQAYVVDFGTGNSWFTADQAGLPSRIPLAKLGEAWCVRGGHGHDGGH